MGSKPGIERKKDFVDSANGLFSAQAAPKPPKALYSVTEGMKVGGKVRNTHFKLYLLIPSSLQLFSCLQMLKVKQFLWC